MSNNEQALTKLTYFNFKKFNEHYLITNDIGSYIFLTNVEFAKLVDGSWEEDAELSLTLKEKEFAFSNNRDLFVLSNSEKLKKRKGHLFCSTQLHIFVLTLRCNQNCIYCQATAQSEAKKSLDMDKEAAEKAVDIALQSPSKYLTFEFQGGEPLLNLETLKHIIEYTKTRSDDKQIIYNLVTNLTYIDESTIEFLINEQVNVSTSIDGPKLLHDHNRPLKGASAFELVKANVQRFNRKISEMNSNVSLQAILTTTRESLTCPREIINAYIDLGFSSIFLRPLTPLGISKRNIKSIGYTPEEFLKFYKQCIDYMHQLNEQGTIIFDVHTHIFLQRIFKKGTTNYMDLRSPCGGALGQLAYNYNGDIYTCDEGRMLSQSGDESFRVGNVFKDNYINLIENPITKSVCIASCIEALPSCAECVYNPYCGTCPILNYTEQKTIFGQMPSNYRCKVHKGILDNIFKELNSETLFSEDNC
ncbi:His-Xaa-Ser system radical SAM maturase HxsB [Desulfosporosinus shakirovi]|uniref:His-Xaa-Ser system radical SAM maturase HxsB n=1 Tax=Desulfosporosinus shakirovi TaxID=2885154 RepID=UPI001E4D2193|nr:His-Xaa-Ser system radical SAM maturase HxsB [Desulfosporosinus sp. SRJS8]MCB8818325.1 His-Xaa-Ser system radical SAM maturase HxsB [Desulfosporosinus sp. SRJS8]